MNYGESFKRAAAEAAAIKWDETTGRAYRVKTSHTPCPDADVKLARGKYEYCGYVAGDMCPSCGGTESHRGVFKRWREYLPVDELKKAQKAVREGMLG